jgi:hypothetical protein
MAGLGLIGTAGKKAPNWGLSRHGSQWDGVRRLTGLMTKLRT